MRSHTSRSPLYASLVVATFTGCAPAATGHNPSSATLITAEDLAKYPGEPVERVLERKVPGVSVTRTASGAISLSIRGVSSIDGGERPPLYVLNGLPIEGSRDGGLPGVDPYDIESIRVIKGGDAGIYGNRGANGVIIITTKTGVSKHDL